LTSIKEKSPACKSEKRSQVRRLPPDRGRDGDRVRPLNSNGHDWTGRFPWIVESALKNRHKQFAIDEAVILASTASPTSTRCTPGHDGAE